MRVEALSNSDRRKPPLQTNRKVVKWWVVDDGYFTGDKRSGVGVTTALLRRNGYVVMNEKQFIEEYVRK